MPYNVPALGEVAKFGTDYFLLKIKFLAKCKREFTTKFAILPNAIYKLVLFDFYLLLLLTLIFLLKKDIAQINDVAKYLGCQHYYCKV